LLNNPTLTHTQRQQVGDYLLELGDPRPGVGLRDDGIPYIEWVPIKGGQIVLEANEGVQCVENFDIARYPVTNIQFQAFIKAGDGYHNPTWRQDMPDNALNEPVSSNWQEPYCPRENISWYEAVAFCEWLSHKLGFEVRLPTEFEWQQAATGGKKERIYPWGADWDANRCNSNESRLNRTTVVGLYPHGTWPEGPLDMAGNVWEWCQNKNEQPSDCTIDKSDDMRTFRGGSWDSRDSACSCTHRDGYRPGYRYGYGFRVLRPTSSKN
jgi:formylglycine-generating enzyme required for sulfatase activity